MTTHSIPNFASILGQSPTEVAQRPLPPVGTYLCTVGKAEAGESSQKHTPFLKFPLKFLAPLEDVDAEALAEIGGVEEIKMSITFYITEDAIPMLDQFHSNCGLDIATDGLTRAERNDEVINAQVLAVVSHRPDNNDKSPTPRVFAEVRRTARAD